MRIFIRKGDYRVCWSLKSNSSMGNQNRIATYIFSERTRKCILRLGDRTSLSTGKRVSRISYFMEDSVVFRGKCAVSILSVSEDPRRGRKYIYRLREEEKENIHIMKSNKDTWTLSVYEQCDRNVTKESMEYILKQIARKLQCVFFSERIY